MKRATEVNLEALAPSVLRASHEAIIVIDELQNIVFFNKGAEQVFGYKASEILGQPLDLLLPPGTEKTHRDDVYGFARSHSAARMKHERRGILGRRKNGEIFPGEASISRTSVGGNKFFIAVFRDITEEERREKQVGLQLALTRAIAEAEDFDSALRSSLLQVCEFAGCDYGEIWLPSVDGLRLGLGPAYYCRERSMEQFRAASEEFEFDPQQGLPGGVWVSRKTAWIPDVTRDENFPRAAQARAAGLHAGVGIPILAGKNVAAVLNLFFKQTRQEDKAIVALVSTVAAQLGAAFLRRQAEDALAKSEAFSQGVLNALPAHLCALDGQGTILAVNQAWVDFARQNDADPATERGVGLNYLQVCETAARSGDEAPRAALEGMRAVMDGAQESFDMEYPCHAPNEQRWFVMRVRPTGREAGSVIVSHQTITERKLADLASQQTQTMYREVVENASDLIYTMDLRGYFKHVNVAGIQTSGYSLQELQATAYLDMILPEYRRKVQKVYLRQFADKLPSSYVEFPYYTKAGELRWLGQSASPIFEGQKIVGYHVIGRDITGRKLAENLLQESETRYRTLFEQSNDLIQSLAPDGSFLFVNEAWRRTLGYTDEEVARLKIFDVIHPDSLEECREAFMRVVNGERVSQIQFKFIAKDERVIEMEGSASPRLADGKVIATQGFFHDVTERKQAEKNLRENEEHFRALIENASDMIVIIDADGNLIYVSPTAQRIAGYQAGEVIGRNIVEFIHAEDLPLALESLANRAKTPGLAPAPIELRFRHKDGTWRLVEILGNNLLDNSSVKGIVLNVRDIAERKQAQEALVANEKRFRALIENSADAITLLNPEGNVIYDSPAAPGLLGYTPDEWINRNIFEAIHPDDQSEARTTLQLVSEKPRNKASLVLRVRHKDGAWRWVEIVATNLLDEPSVRAVVVNYGDITERRRAQIASNLMQATALAIAEAPDFNSALDSALRTLCEATGWKYAEAWIPRPDKSALELGPVWYGTGESVQTFRRASQEFIFHPSEGLPGRVWANKTPEWIADVSVNHETFLRAPQALETGLRAGMGIPIIGNGDVLVVAFFMFETRPEDRAMMETAMAVGNQLGTLLLRKRAEDENRRKTEELQLIQSLNNAANRGESIERIFELLRDGTSKIFSSRGAAFYRVSEDGSHLEIAVQDLPSDLMKRIEKLIGMELPKLEVPLREGGLYREILLGGQPRLVNDPQSIQRLMSEFTDNPALEKMVGAIHAILGDHSVVSVPLISEGKPIGLLEISRKEPFIEADLDRLAVIGGEVTAILQRKRAEENLLVSEEKFRTLTETLPVGVSISTPKGEVIEANPALVKMTGYDSKEEFLQDSAVVHYRDPQDRSRYIAQLMERGTVTGYEAQLVRKDGSDFWASASSVVQKHPDGSITLVHSVEDITARKLRQDELETLLAISLIVTQTSDLEALLQNILDAVVNVLPAAEKGAILLADEAGNLHIRAMSGYSDARILGSIFSSTSGYAARTFRLREALIVPDALAEEEIRYDGDIGEIATVQSAMVAPLNAQGQAIGVISIDNATHTNAFTEEDLRLLVTISSSVALAIHRARLLEETRQRLERVQGLHEIDLTIANTFDLRQMLDIVLKQAIDLLGVDAASVLLLNPTSYRLEFAAGLGFRTRLIESVRLPLGNSFAGRALMERRLVHVSDYAAAQEDPDFADFWMKEELHAYFAVPLIVKGQVKGALEVFHRAPRASAESLKEWIGFLETLAGQAALAVENIHLFEGLQRANAELSLAYDATIEGWSQAMDLRDKETEGHTRRVTRLTMELARATGVREDELIHVRRGALLHDIGKMGVSDGILLKSDKLTEAEWALMRKHPAFAYDMLSPISYLKLALDIPYCHHEKWDGTGYPRSLKGEQIPLAARLFAFADVYDALTSNRPYRAAWSKEKALEYIKEQSGKQFDPSLINIVLSVIAEYEEDSQ